MLDLLQFLHTPHYCCLMSSRQFNPSDRSTIHQGKAQVPQFHQVLLALPIPLGQS